MAEKKKLKPNKNRVLDADLLSCQANEVWLVWLVFSLHWPHVSLPSKRDSALLPRPCVSVPYPQVNL